MNIERELMRGAGPIAVLTLLRRDEKYGYQIAQELAERFDGVLPMGQSTLYPLLYNLESKGLVEGVWRESEAGRDRKYYRLTERGQKRLAEDTRVWRGLARAMGELGVLAAPASGEARLATAGGGM